VVELGFYWRLVPDFSAIWSRFWVSLCYYRSCSFLVNLEIGILLLSDLGVDSSFLLILLVRVLFFFSLYNSTRAEF
jgi:hypothetical protein